MEDVYNGVRIFLEKLDLQIYWDVFKRKGFDREDDLLDLTVLDLLQIEVTKEHAEIIISEANSHQLTESFGLQRWLDLHGLGYYYENFMLNGIESVDNMLKIKVNDDLFDQLEIVIPGHRRRLTRAVRRKTRKRKINQSEKPTHQQEHISEHNMTNFQIEQVSRILLLDDDNGSDVSRTKSPFPGDAEYPLAVGRWKKPLQFLDEDCSECLYVTATVQSTCNHELITVIDLMVDSGSDVSTLKPEVLEQLHLRCVGVCRSHGIHASAKKDLYRANIWIGGRCVCTEVVAEEYNSLGNQVIKNFRHYIDSTRHVWLSNDAVDDTEVPPLEDYGDKQLGQSVQNDNVCLKDNDADEDVDSHVTSDSVVPHIDVPLKVQDQPP